MKKLITSFMWNWILTGACIEVLGSGVFSKKLIKVMVFFIITCTGNRIVAAQPDASSAFPQSLNSNIHPLIQKSMQAIGFYETDGKILHYNAAKQTLWDYQSDRQYPPFISYSDTKELWYDFENNTEKALVESIYPTAGPTPRMTYFSSFDKSLQHRNDTTIVQVPDGTGSDPYLNPFMVLADWAVSENILEEKAKVYREYPRNVLSRVVNGRTEYLFLDSKTNFPVKIEFQEPHYLWGQVTVEYLYTTWWSTDQIDFPLASYRIVDGRTVVSRIHGNRELISSPGITMPEDFRPLMDQTLFFLRQSRPDTIRVSDNLYLLKNPAYTEAVALINDTVYLFDATQGEQRAKYDHEWIKKLFGDEYPVTVIVTDLAWPHIGGVRYWVSQGADIISHENSQEFLRKVVDRKWRLNPDELENNRKKSSFKFTPVSDKRVISNGHLELYPIDGIGSEGALMVFIKETGFLWAGDFIQTADSPSKYAKEILEAVGRNQIDPEQVAAQHLLLTPWSTIEALFN